MTSKCLVTFRERNFVLPFDGTLTRRELIDRIKDHEFFRGVDVAILVVTVFDEDFKVFVEMPEDYVVQDRTKIKVSENSQVRIVDVLEREVPQQAEQPHIAGTYTLTYSLPAVPHDIQLCIGRHQAGQYFKGRNKVVQWLYHDLCVYTMYPGKLYTEAAQALVAKYPNLADSTGTGFAGNAFIGMGEGRHAESWLFSSCNIKQLEDSWRESLRFKAKYERRKLRVQQNDAEESPPPKKTAKEVAEKEDMRNVLLRVVRPSVAAIQGDSEDESIAGHIEAMRREVGKARPDIAYIADCMWRTLSRRRHWIGSENPSVETILEKYPALSLSSIVQLEFELITNVPVLQSLEQALDHCKEKVVQAARKKRHLESFLEDFDARISGASETTVYEATITAAICLLPSLVKERMESFVCHFDPTAVHYIPTVVQHSNILSTTDFSACLESVIMQETSLLAALATQMSLYWTFNIVFASKAHRSFDLLCRLIKVDSGLRPTPLVRMALTVLGK